ncbi:MAG TPA: thiamine pyrophosphate-dependent enzyme [Chitinophagales bacterium]|nr:thiamine pyrophosphate-dependent enzyme [Chitinophagales bacterium]
MAATKTMEVSEQSQLTFEEFKRQIMTDYRLAVISREASLVGRKEVLRGKAKFGIFGDGKEIAQLAMAKVFREGDWRSGYYRDQTFAFATGICSVKEFFAQLYADTNPDHEPMSGGRQMNAHFATRFIDGHGNWKDQTAMMNSSADSSPTSSQMPRSLGLAVASKKYRECEDLKSFTEFSHNGDEVVFATVGDASTSEGHFWETLNAAGVLKVPLAITVWDDGYGISVPIKYQTTKGSISEICAGFQTEDGRDGVDIYVVNGWDYPSLVETYEKAIAKTRETHIPALIHVKELTQPQGHSTSGSHERYKSKERLEWEKEFDCNRKMREWMIKYAIATADELDETEKEAREFVTQERLAAWNDFNEPIKKSIAELSSLLDEVSSSSSYSEEILEIKNKLNAAVDAIKKDALIAAKNVLIVLGKEQNPNRERLVAWKNDFENEARKTFTSHLYNESFRSAMNVAEVKAEYADAAPVLNGFEILNHFFDAALAREPRLFAFGEDLGAIGDVNQGFAGLQAKYGEQRVSDVGIREQTIIGQGIGMAMRGLRPIAEIQYLDYLLFGLQTMSDDLASLHYRTAGGQSAPLIIRTRGHRLEGIWHSGSPIGMIINSIRGIYLLVPRNMTQAAGFYNTMLQSDDPALIIECLNGYRLKEKLPSNIGNFTVPLGIPEILIEGNDVTLVTYGSCCRIAAEAIEKLNQLGISVELIDVQTLLPFDLHHKIGESIRKTNRVVFLDEDVPGGASAYMYQQVMEKQNIWQWLDSPPVTISAQPNRPAYASDGDYFCKPQVEDVFEAVYGMMHEVSPEEFPKWD